MVVGELAHERDVIVIGGGPGGYHAAIRAAQHGRTVTIIEKEKLGGVCLNKGCIPSKVFTQGAERLANLKKDEEFGIQRTDFSFNLEKLSNYKNKTIQQLRQGVEALCKSNQIEVVNGSAFFLSDDKIGVESGDSYEVYKFSNAIIATGSTPSTPTGVQVDHKRLFNSWSITEIQEVPSDLIVYGSDYIALEMATSFQTFGANVTLILDGEKEDFPFDASINRELKRILKKSKISVLKGLSLKEAKATSEGVTVSLDEKGEVKSLYGSHLFLSTGTKPNIENLGLDRLKIELTQEGHVQVNAQCQTSLPHIYAIGDITEGPALAVKSIHQGKTAADHLGGVASETDLHFIPSVIQTNPPVASVGLTEEEARLQGYDIAASEFPLMGNGFATITGKKDGLVKVIIDRDSDLLLGMHMIGHGAVELISSGILALEMVGRDEDLRFPLYPHPSINEGLLEAVEALKGHAIHLVPKKQVEKVKV